MEGGASRLLVVSAIPAFASHKRLYGGSDTMRQLEVSVTQDDFLISVTLSFSVTATALSFQVSPVGSLIEIFEPTRGKQHLSRDFP